MAYEILKEKRKTAVCYKEFGFFDFRHKYPVYFFKQGIYAENSKDKFLLAFSCFSQFFKNFAR